MHLNAKFLILLVSNSKRERTFHIFYNLSTCPANIENGQEQVVGPLRERHEGTVSPGFDRGSLGRVETTPLRNPTEVRGRFRTMPSRLWHAGHRVLEGHVGFCHRRI